MAREQRTEDEVAYAAQLGDLIRRCRVKAGLNPAQLADKLGVSISRISQMETGRHGISAFLLSEVLSACGFQLVLPNPDLSPPIPPSSDGNNSLIELIDQRISIALSKQ